LALPIEVVVYRINFAGLQDPQIIKLGI